MMRIAVLTVLVSMAVLAAGCGWRLQGSEHLPEVMAVTYIDTQDRYTDFNKALRERLAASGSRLVPSSSGATATVRVHKDESGRRVLSVSARNTPEEYQVYYSVQYSVSSGATELISRQTLELTRDYSYDETAVLAKEREQMILREALARDLASLVLRRLASL